MRWIAIGLLLVGICSPATAQLDPQQIIDAAAGKSERMRELAALFQHPDPAVRVEAFNQMSASNDPLERNLAFQSALNSTDVDLRSLAITKRLEEMNPLVVTIYRGESPAERFVSRVIQGNDEGIVSTPQISFDALRGTFVLSYTDTPPSQVVGDEVRLAIQLAVTSYPVCSGRLQLVDGVALAGDLDCTEGYGSFPVRIDLFH